ncbi:pachytene checkpoint component Pch2 [Trichodelitschia bisporula]|uniref:Pachytene checkpoint component Pch2 n=1 Tax=Trichodelitschia bisporula TaxID=703511 RepID=A0A6G1IAT8_9PEZI|nr:pachytene checkpoint component Pch2 [Trichodelitschia bisporula]
MHRHQRLHPLSMSHTTSDAVMTTTSCVNKPSLNVEVRLKDVSCTFVRTDLVREEVYQWLLNNFIHLRIDQELTEFGSLKCGDIIDSISVVDFSGKSSGSAFHRVADVNVDVHARPARSSQDESDDDPTAQFRISSLPSKALSNAWDGLIFDDDIPTRLLHSCGRMLTIMRRCRINSSLINWNRLLLLYGPPGSGKSTLCRALAQKLTIRLGKYFTQGKLVEINANAVLSKWFGESGKLVKRMFNQVHKVAVDETTLVCVLIDEVETLAGCREKAVSGNEIGDALRATNQLLTALDRLRHQPNIIVFCTSNLIAAIDPAFLDRVDITECIPQPSPRAVYEIFRSGLQELMRCNIITQGGGSTVVNPTQCGHDGACSRPPKSGCESKTVQLLPSLAEVEIHLWNRPEAPGSRLWAIAQNCRGFSGRSLRRLPMLSIAMYTYGEACTIEEALHAMATAVGEEIARMEDGKNGSSM